MNRPTSTEDAELRQKVLMYVRDKIINPIMPPVKKYDKQLDIWLKSRDWPLINRLTEQHTDYLVALLKQQSDAARVEKQLYQTKLQAIAYRHYQGSKWEPKLGDYYTIDRKDLQFFKIVDETDSEFVIEPVYPSTISGRSTFAKDGFTDKDFGAHRCLVIDCNFEDVLAQLNQAPQAGKEDDE